MPQTISVINRTKSGQHKLSYFAHDSQITVPLLILACMSKDHMARHLFQEREKKGRKQKLNSKDNQKSLSCYIISLILETIKQVNTNISTPTKGHTPL